MSAKLEPGCKTAARRALAIRNLGHFLETFGPSRSNARTEWKANVGRKVLSTRGDPWHRSEGFAYSESNPITYTVLLSPLTKKGAVEWVCGCHNCGTTADGDEPCIHVWVYVRVYLSGVLMEMSKGATTNTGRFSR